MSIKKLLVLAAAGITSSAALAGAAVKYTAPPVPPAPVKNNTGVYIEGLAGYNRYAFSDVVPTSDNWSNGSGNWAFGADIGYQFHQYFSAELGGIYTLNAKYTLKKKSTDVRPWYAYLAGKISVPLYENVSAFAKLGLGYQKIKVNDTKVIVSDNVTTSNWGAMFGAGIAYNITPEFYLSGEWLRFTGKTKVDDKSKNIAITTAPNIFLLGVGYKFAM